MNRPDLGTMKGFDPKLFMSYADKVGHGAAVGIAYHDHGPDWVELALPYDEKLIGVAESGILASGPIISLMDMATSLAIWVKLDKSSHKATLDLRVEYMRPATPGTTTIGRGECSRGPTNGGFVRGLAHEGSSEE